MHFSRSHPRQYIKQKLTSISKSKNSKKPTVPTPTDPPRDTFPQVSSHPKTRQQPHRKAMSPKEDNISCAGYMTKDVQKKYAVYYAPEGSSQRDIERSEQIRAIGITSPASRIDQDFRAKDSVTHDNIAAAMDRKAYGIKERDFGYDKYDPRYWDSRK